MSADPTGERILDAAMQTMLSFGIRRATVDEIARRAGVSHMTVYRRWPTKNQLLLAVLIREAQTVFTAIDQEIAALSSAEDKLIAGFTGIYWYVHTHPLFSRTVETDPESVLPVLTAEGGVALDMATTYLAGHIESTSGAAVDDPYVVAEVFVRLTHSLLLTPRVRDPLNSREDAERYARQHILPIAQALVRAPTGAAYS